MPSRCGRRREQPPLVTVNVADFEGEPDLVLVCVLKRNRPPESARRALAALLDR